MTVAFTPAGNIQDVDLLLNGVVVATKTNPPPHKAGEMTFNVDVSSEIGPELVFTARGYKGNRSAGLYGESAPCRVLLQRLQIKTVSNRADLISGGDALMEIVVPPGISADGLNVRLNGADVTGAFAVRSNGKILGLVTGLTAGPNTVTASATHAQRVKLEVTNHPSNGPILLGTQPQPRYCATPTPKVMSGIVPATNASGLSSEPDANCNIPSEFFVYYRTKATDCTYSLPDPSPTVSPTATTVPATPAPPANGCFKPWSTSVDPASIATTKTDAGITVPFIVRVERGTMNRGIYDIAVLFDPSKPWTAVAPQPAWNGKVFFSFGGSTSQPRRQSRPATNWTAAYDAIGLGYAAVSSDLLDGARNSNRVITAETVMMIKEHIGDTYGPVKWAIGLGASGGSMSQNQIDSYFPGLLDGSITYMTFADQDANVRSSADCVLLSEAFQKAQWLTLMSGKTQAEIDAKKAAISGSLDQTFCHSFYSAGTTNRAGNPGLYFNRTVTDLLGTITQAATQSNNCELPNPAVYDASHAAETATLPRCDMWSSLQSAYGVAPNGNGKHTRDNVGVQYGLQALTSGAITAEEFVTLNEIIGGFDRDLKLSASRTEADTDALAIAYRSGLITSAKQLAKMPIIDMRGWNDSTIVTPPGGTPTTSAIHSIYHGFAVHHRLLRDVGTTQSRAMWRYARTGLNPPGTMTLDALTGIDQWIAAIKADTTGRPIEEKVRAARPASVFDYCLLPDDVAQSTKITDQSVCDANQWLKPTLSARQVAGESKAEDTIKCQLKPFNQAEYSVTFSSAQQARLQAVFATGVCDYSKPGIGQQDAVGPLTFKSGPGGQPIGPEPVSIPF